MEAVASTVLALPGSQDRFAMRKHHAHLSDEALVALVARGDEDALAELYDRVGRIAYGLALRVLRDERHAEDAVQEAFLQVWRSAATFRAERAKASTWILTLVHRRAVDLVRREERRQADPLTDDSAVGEAPARRTEEAAWLRFERERVQSALEAAPRRPARGARARLLRRVLAIRARREARRAARHDQEQDVRRARASARAPRRLDPGRIMEAGIHELTAGYALDALDPDERAAYEAHLAGCEQCQQELESFWQTTEALAVAASGRRRARRCATRILADVRAEPPQNVVPFEPRRRRLAPVLGAVAAVAAVVALAIGLWAAHLSSQLDDTRAALERERAERRGARRPEAAVGRAPGRRRPARRRSRRAGRARRSTASTRRRQGKTYELWIMPGGNIDEANPAGLFPGRTEPSVVGVDGTVQSGDVVAVTVEAPAASTRRRPLRSSPRTPA